MNNPNKIAFFSFIFLLFFVWGGLILKFILLWRKMNQNHSFLIKTLKLAIGMRMSEIYRKF